MSIKTFDLVGTIHGREYTEWGEYVSAVDYREIKAEIAGLRTGYEAYEQVNAELKAENERIERNRDMWKGQVERQAEELTSMRKDAEQWRALVGRAKDPVIGYTGCVICGSADHGGWSCQNHPGGKS